MCDGEKEKTKKKLTQNWLAKTIQEIVLNKLTSESELAQSVAERAYNTFKSIDCFSDRAIRLLLFNTIVEHKKNDNFAEIAKIFIDNFDFAPEDIEAMLPLERVAIDPGQELEIGKVTVSFFSEQLAQRHSNHFFKAVNTPPDGRPNGVTKQTITHMPQTVAVVRFRAIRYAQLDVANTLVEEAINILRLFISPRSLSKNGISFGFGNSFLGPNDICSFLSLKDNSIIHLCSDPYKPSGAGPYQERKLTQEEIIRISSNNRFQIISTILKKDTPQMNDIERRIRTAASLIGKALQLHDDGHRFLLFAIGIETLFSLDDSDLTEHLALCISKLETSDSDIRRHHYSQIKSLYKKRSAMVHSGDFHILEKDLINIFHYAEHGLSYAIDEYSINNKKPDWPLVLIKLKLS